MTCKNNKYSHLFSLITLLLFIWEATGSEGSTVQCATHASVALRLKRTAAVGLLWDLEPAYITIQGEAEIIAFPVNG